MSTKTSTQQQVELIEANTIEAFVDRESAKRKKGYCRSKGRKHPLGKCAYIPYKGAFAGQRHEFAIVACGIHDGRRAVNLKRFDENDEIVEKHRYKVMEGKDQGWETIRMI